MYVDTHHFALDDNKSAHSINDLSRADLVKIYRALATVPISPEDRLFHKKVAHELDLDDMTDGDLVITDGTKQTACLEVLP